MVYFVFLAFLVNTMGYYVIFEVNRFLVRKEVRAASGDNRAIHVIEIGNGEAVNELKWIGRDEFFHRGKLYDVICSAERERSTIYYCIHDLKEQILLKEFQKVNEGKLTQALWNHLVKVAIPSSRQVLSVSSQEGIIYPRFTIPLLNISLSPVVPPS